MSSELVKLVADNVFVVMGGTVCLVAIIASAVRSVVSSLARERSRREIAAYIAEKSMSPDEGERLMNAGNKDARC